MHELHARLHVRVLLVQIHATHKGGYARVDGSLVCDGVKAVESTRRAEDGMARWEIGWRICKISLCDVGSDKGHKATSMPQIPWGDCRHVYFITSIVYLRQTRYSRSKTLSKQKTVVKQSIRRQSPEARAVSQSRHNGQLPGQRRGINN